MECRDDDQNEREIYNSPKNLQTSMEQYKLRSILSPMTSEDNLSTISNGTSFTASTIKTPRSLIIRNEERFDLTELVRDTHTNDEVGPFIYEHHESFEDNPSIEQLQAKSQMYAEEARRLFQSVLTPNQESKCSQSSSSSIPTRNQEMITKNAFRYARTSRKLLQLSHLKQKQQLDPRLHLGDEKFDRNTHRNYLAWQHSACPWNNWDNLSPTTEGHSHVNFYPEKDDDSTFNTSLHEDFPGYFPELEFIALLTKSNMESLAQMATDLLADPTSLFDDDCRYICNNWHENYSKQTVGNTPDIASIVRMRSIPKGSAGLEENKKMSLKPIFRAQNLNQNRHKPTESISAISSFENYLELPENCMEFHQEEEEISPTFSLNKILHIKTDEMEDPIIKYDVPNDVSNLKPENRDEQSPKMVITSETKSIIYDHNRDNDNHIQICKSVCEPEQIENEDRPRNTKNGKRFKFIRSILKRKRKNKNEKNIDNSKCKEETNTTENRNDSNLACIEERDEPSKCSDEFLMEDECKENKNPLREASIQKETTMKGYSNYDCNAKVNIQHNKSSNIIYYPKNSYCYSGSSLTMSPLSHVTERSSTVSKLKAVSEYTSPTSRCFEELQQKIDHQPLTSFDFSAIDTIDDSSRTKNKETKSLLDNFENSSVQNLEIDRTNTLPQELQNMSDFPTFPIERSFSDIIHYSKVPNNSKDTFDTYLDLRKSSSCPVDRYLYKGCSTTAGEMFESFINNQKTDINMSMNQPLFDQPDIINNDNNNSEQTQRLESTTQIITSLRQGHGHNSIELMDVRSNPSHFAEASAKRGRNKKKVVKFVSESPQRNFCERSEGYYLNLLTCSPHSQYTERSKDHHRVFEDDDFSKASSSAMSSIVDMSRWNGYRLF